MPDRKKGPVRRTGGERDGKGGDWEKITLRLRLINHGIGSGKGNLLVKESSLPRDRHPLPCDVSSGVPPGLAEWPISTGEHAHQAHHQHILDALKAPQDLQSEGRSVSNGPRSNMIRLWMIHPRLHHGMVTASLLEVILIPDPFDP